jgi:hypothetical protein
LTAAVTPIDVDGTAAAVGTSTEAARADHRHTARGATAVAVSTGTGNAAGTSTSLARADHVHQVEVGSNTAAVDVPDDGSTGLTALTSVDTYEAMADMSVTLAQGGVYLALFGAHVLNNNAGDDEIHVEIRYTVGGTPTSAAASERPIWVKKNTWSHVQTFAVVTVAAGEAVQGWWKSGLGTSAEAWDRSLTLVRLRTTP